MMDQLHQIKAWLDDIHWMAPWVVLALASFAAEVVLLKLKEHKPFAERFPRTAGALPSVRGLWATIIGAAWAAGTTGDPEDAVYGAVSGAILPLVIKFKKEFLALGALLLIGCSADMAAREVCYADVRLRFSASADMCDTEACIDELSELEAEELAECP